MLIHPTENYKVFDKAQIDASGNIKKATVSRLGWAGFCGSQTGVCGFEIKS